MTKFSATLANANQTISVLIGAGYATTAMLGKSALSPDVRAELDESLDKMGEYMRQAYGFMQKAACANDFEWFMEAKDDLNECIEEFAEIMREITLECKIWFQD